MDLTQATDELLSASWESFVETRARLADELARAGKRDDSRALKKVRRPTAAAWATNQVVRQARAAVDGYLTSSDELRGRQAAMLAGGGDRSAYQTAAEAHRSATAALSQAVRQVLQEGGREPERAQVEGVMANVRAAALADDRRAELLAGRLLTDLSAGEGLEGLFGASLAAGAATTAPLTPAPTPEAKRRAVAHQHHDARPSHEAEAAARREAASRARREEHARLLAAAKDDEAAAREAAVTAASDAEQARAARDTAQTQLHELEVALGKAREALEEAASALRTAEQQATKSERTAHHASQHRQTLEKTSPT